MVGTTIESLFGTNAGIVWRALNQNGATNLANLVKTTSLSREEIHGALGWLGRENKIIVEKNGRAMVFSLRDEEACLAVPAETNLAELSAKTKSRKNKSPKKTKKARSVKASAKQTVNSAAKQADKMAEFLLH